MKKINRKTLKVFIDCYNFFTKERARLWALLHEECFEAGFEAGVDYDLSLIEDKDIDFGLPFSWWKLTSKGDES